MKNVWLTHVAMYHKKHPQMTYGEAMKAAKASYKKKPMKKKKK
jgi:hypothetical protein